MSILWSCHQEIYVCLEELLLQGALELFVAFEELSGLPAKQGVTQRCRLSWLTNCARV